MIDPIVPPPLPSNPNQPTPQQLGALLEADRSAKKIRRAARFAKGDAWTIAVLGGFTLLGGFNDLSTILLAALMAYVTWREFQGAANLARFDANAPRSLAINQIVFAAGVILYSLWQLHASSSASVTNELAGVDPEVAKMYGSTMGDMAKSIASLIYGGVIVCTIFAQGGVAIYYESRRKIVERYVEETPQWIMDYQRREQ